MAAGTIISYLADATNKTRVEYWSFETSTETGVPFFVVDNRYAGPTYDETDTPLTVTVQVDTVSDVVLHTSLSHVDSISWARGIDQEQAARYAADSNTYPDAGYRLYVTIIGS